MILDHSSYCPGASIHALLQETFAFLKYTSREAYEPKELMNASRPAWFTAGMQQDCSEYVKYLIDRLQNEEETNVPLSITGNEQKTCPPSRASGCDQGEIVADGCNDKCMVRENSCDQLSMSTIFSGVTGIEMQCLNCKRISTNKEEFMDISLSLTQEHLTDEAKSEGLKGGALPHSSAGTSSSLQPEQMDTSSSRIIPAKATHKFDDLLNNYLQDEILDGDNKYQCSHCNSLQVHYNIIQLNY